MPKYPRFALILQKALQNPVQIPLFLALVTLI
jgi:hypothetical protein